MMFGFLLFSFSDSFLNIGLVVCEMYLLVLVLFVNEMVFILGCFIMVLFVEGFVLWMMFSMFVGIFVLLVILLSMNVVYGVIFDGLVII